ncbi:hypothetical protein D1007_31968 [Hordeum vulgare]|nr:hypothetical protein D1007_31968 [Hordeum vulgare]
MADARWDHAECPATRVAQTAPVGPSGARQSPSPMVNAATGPDAQEQQGSSQPATKKPDGRTATLSLVRASRSASRARPEMPHGQRAFAMASELLRYWPAPDRHNDWLQRIEELVTAAGDPVVLSCSYRPQPSLANDEEQDAPPPPLQRGAPRAQAGSTSPRPASRTQGGARR